MTLAVCKSLNCCLLQQGIHRWFHQFKPLTNCLGRPQPLQGLLVAQPRMCEGTVESPYQSNYLPFCGRLEWLTLGFITFGHVHPYLLNGDILLDHAQNLMEHPGIHGVPLRAQPG